MKENKTPKLPELESRSYSCEVRADGDGQGSIITGRPIVYGSMTDIGGWFAEVIDRGALDTSDLTDVRFLVNHDAQKIPLARSRRNNGNSTMQLSVDDSGLNIRAELDTENNPEAKALYSAVSRGDISGMSFMFSVKSERWDNLDSDYPTRHILQIGSVVEVSACTFPAYTSTEISARGKDALESARSALENARRQKAEPPEGGNEIDLLHEKLKLLGGI